MNVFVLSSFHIGFFPQVIFRLISNPVVILYFTVVSHIYVPKYITLVISSSCWSPGDGRCPLRCRVEEQKDEGVDRRVGDNCHPNYCLKVDLISSTKLS